MLLQFAHLPIAVTQLGRFHPEAKCCNPGFYIKQKGFNSIVFIVGVRCIYYDNFVSTDKTVEEVNQLARDKGFVKNNDLVVNLAAMPVKDRGQVNTLRLSRL